MRYILTALLTIVLGATAAEACSCYTPAGPEEMANIHLDRSDIAFEGRVTELAIVRQDDAPIDSSRNEKQVYARALLRVSAVWKGELAEETVVYTPLSQGSCGAEFILGECIIVFAKRQDGAIYTDRCMGTWSNQPRGAYLGGLGRPELVLDVPECNFATIYRR